MQEESHLTPEKPTAEVKADDAEQLVANSAKESSPDATHNPLKPSRPWYRKPLFWVGSGALLVGIVSITLGLIYRSNVMSNQQKISDGWHQLVQSSDQAVVLAGKVKNSDNYNDYSNQLHSLQSTTQDKKYSAAKLPTFLANKGEVDRYKQFLNDFDSYIANAATQSDDIAGFTTADKQQLGQQSTAAHDSSDALKNSSSFLQENMPSQIFDIASTLDSIKTNIDLKNSQQQAAQAAANAAAAQDTANAQTVQTNVGQYLAGFVAGNATQMRKYMTTAFQQEFDFNQLNPDQRQTVYPASYRVVSTKKQDDGSYMATANITFKYRDNSGQYTTGYEYSLVSTTQAVGWLINTEKTGSSY